MLTRQRGSRMVNEVPTRKTKLKKGRDGSLYMNLTSLASFGRIYGALDVMLVISAEGPLW